jgi:hypothetical protein
MGGMDGGGAVESQPFPPGHIQEGTIELD